MTFASGWTFDHNEFELGSAKCPAPWNEILLFVGETLPNSSAASSGLFASFPLNVAAIFRDGGIIAMGIPPFTRRCLFAARGEDVSSGFIFLIKSTRPSSNRNCFIKCPFAVLFRNFTFPTLSASAANDDTSPLSSTC